MSIFLSAVLPSGSTISIPINATSSIVEVKEEIANEEKLVTDQLELLYEGELADDSTLCEIASKGGEVEVVLSKKGIALIELGQQPTKQLAINFITSNNLSGIMNCIAAGIGINTTLKNGRTALYLACESGSLSICQYLLRDPDVDPTIASDAGYQPLYVACRSKSRAIAKLIINHPSVVGNQECLAAGMRVTSTLGEIETARELLLNGGVDLSSSVYIRSPPLIAAATHGNVDLVRLLLTRPEINLDSCPSALLAACKGDSADIVRMILERCKHGINKLDPLTKDTALHIAVRNGNLDIISLLLSVKICKVNICNAVGQCPLRIACSSGNVQVVRLLLAIPRVNVNSRDLYGGTPLFNAAKSGDLEMVKILASHPDINFNNGKSAMEAALKQNHFDVADYLRGQVNNDFDFM